jgi:hypothetical protein
MNGGFVQSLQRICHIAYQVRLLSRHVGDVMLIVRMAGVRRKN